jgi:IS30 family transposase
MTKKYNQLTLVQRYQIEALHQAGMNQSNIALNIGVHKSTVSRELKRNVPKRGIGAKIYNASKAQSKTDLRHALKFKHTSFSLLLKAEVRELMSVEKLSPELIAAKWSKEGKPGVCHETIYKNIWLAKQSNRKEHLPDKQLYKHLKHGKRRRKRGNYNDSRGLIPNRVSIEQRPKIVEQRGRLGDIEVDLIIGKNHQGGLLVTLDRASLKTTINKIESKDSKKISALILKRMKDASYLKTMTFDNDQAFCMHEEIAKKLHIETFFTRPYTSQDKGSIENRNGVIRRFFPKKTNFSLVTEKEIENVERFINNRPIRKFGYKSANEVHLSKSNVALTG